MKRQPLVSVVMPIYNAGKFLKPAIESILNQTYEKFELILVDDASTDTSTILIEQYKSTYPKKIRVVTIPTNLNGGGDKCANEGIKIARGKYIARMDADDVAHKRRFEKQVAFLEENSNVFLVGSNAYVINGNGKIIGEKLEPSTPTEIYHAYFRYHPLIHPTCMFRRKINDKLFSYRVDYKANNDYLTFFTLLCKGSIFANLDEKLLYYRIHGKNDTFKNIKQKFLNTLKIRARMISQFGYRPSPKSIIYIFAQFLVAFLLPEKMLISLYMAISSKGALSTNQLYPTIVQAFASLRNSLRTQTAQLLTH